MDLFVICSLDYNNARGCFPAQEFLFGLLHLSTCEQAQKIKTILKKPLLQFCWRQFTQVKTFYAYGHKEEEEVVVSFLTNLVGNETMPSASRPMTKLNFAIKIFLAWFPFLDSNRVQRRLTPLCCTMKEIQKGHWDIANRKVTWRLDRLHSWICMNRLNFFMCKHGTCVYGGFNSDLWMDFGTWNNTPWPRFLR